MAINVGNDKVKTVGMGTFSLLVEEQDHLLTYGLGPCVAVAVVLKKSDGKIIRLLSHIDMGQIFGISIENFGVVLRRLNKYIVDSKCDIKISITSTESYNCLKYIQENEAKLLAQIIKSFEFIGITIKDIEFNNSSQVQISPKGDITAYTESQLEEHRTNMLEHDINAFGGFTYKRLNIYITKYGAYMGNCSLKNDCSEEEKKKYLASKCWQEYISSGYKLVIGQSFNNPDCMAIYLENWNDLSLRKYGTVPGCVQAYNPLHRFTELDRDSFKTRDDMVIR